MRYAIFFMMLMGCGGGVETNTGAGGSCVSGEAPPPGDYCHPCEQAVCPCSGGTGIATCLPSGKGYGECVCPTGETYQPCDGDGVCNPDWGGGLCGPVTVCPNCEKSTGQCCEASDTEAILTTCSP